MSAVTQLFRFQDLEIWRRSADLAFTLGGIADRVEQQHRYRFAEQLRSAALSMSNNIAEGSGSATNNEFRKFLSYARRSAFECANMLLAFERQSLVAPHEIQPVLAELHDIGRMITGFSRSLR